MTYQDRAENVLPGGALGTRLNPEGLNFTVATSRGARIRDTDGDEWIDYVMGGGALILGHQDEAVVEAIQLQASRGSHQYANLSDTSIDLAERLVDAVPNAERMVFTTTGSEATSQAMRMARAFTGKPKIVKFEGAFHGNHDYASVAVWPNEPSPYPAGLPFTDGAPREVAETMLVSPYNDLERLELLLEARVEEIAGVIVEPVQRIILPDPEFLGGVRDLCSRHGVVLIFDEVVTGFRLAYGGAQEFFGVSADLASYGKIIGGGLPGGAVIGRAALIDQASPHRKGTPGYVYASGTHHGNPLAAAAGLATLDQLRDPSFYVSLATRTELLVEAMRDVFARRSRETLVESVGSMWQFTDASQPPRNWTDVLASDRAATMALDTQLLHEGVNVIPGLRRFVSTAHTDDDFDQTIEALVRACMTLEVEQ